MSNYNTSYSIAQSGDLYTLQDHGTTAGLAQYTSTRGTTVNAPMNGRPLKLFRNYDNTIFFFIKNQDRKPIFLQGIQVVANLVNRETGNIIYTTKAITIDPDLGSCKVIIYSGDTANIDDGFYSLVLSYIDSFGLNQPLYTDQNMRPNFTIEVTNEGWAEPIPTQELSEWYDPHNDGFLYSQRIAGPTYYGKRAGNITFGVYATGYTGKFYMQGTAAEQPEEADWFDLDLGQMTYYYQFVNFTGIEPFNLTSNLKYLRAKFEPADDVTVFGTVDKVVVRV